MYKYIYTQQFNTASQFKRDVHRSCHIFFENIRKSTEAIVDGARSVIKLEQSGVLKFEQDKIPIELCDFENETKY